MIERKLTNKELKVVKEIEKREKDAKFVRLTKGVESKRCFWFNFPEEKDDWEFFRLGFRVISEVYEEDIFDNEIQIID